MEASSGSPGRKSRYSDQKAGIRNEEKGVDRESRGGRGNRRGERERRVSAAAASGGSEENVQGSWKFHNQSDGGANHQAQANVDKRAEGRRRR